MPYVNEQGKVSGFGNYHDGTNWVMNQRKQTGYFRRVQDQLCDEYLAANHVQLTGRNFCAMDLDREASICHGDIGSGMTVYIDEVNCLVGVVSVFTNMCHSDYPAVFTKVEPYLQWIKEQTDGEVVVGGH